MRFKTGMEMVEVDESCSREGYFTPQEKEYCESRKKSRVQHYAGRLAVKRAFLKAVGKTERECPLVQMEVSREAGRSPRLILSESVKAQAGISDQDEIFVSLAHERKVAVGLVVISRP